MTQATNPVQVEFVEQSVPAKRLSTRPESERGFLRTENHLSEWIRACKHHKN